MNNYLSTIYYLPACIWDSWSMLVRKLTKPLPLFLDLSLNINILHSSTSSTKSFHFLLWYPFSLVPLENFNSQLRYYPTYIITKKVTLTLCSCARHRSKMFHILTHLSRITSLWDGHYLYSSQRDKRESPLNSVIFQAFPVTKLHSNETQAAYPQSLCY